MHIHAHTHTHLRTSNRYFLNDESEIPDSAKAVRRDLSQAQASVNSQVARTALAWRVLDK